MSAVRHLLNRLRDRGRMLAGEPFFDCRMSAAQLELLDQFGMMTRGTPPYLAKKWSSLLMRSGVSAFTLPESMMRAPKNRAIQ